MFGNNTEVFETIVLMFNRFAKIFKLNVEMFDVIVVLFLAIC